MNNDHKISPATPSKLSSDQIKQLLHKGDIVDPMEPEVQALLARDATEDPQTGKPFFYPYYDCVLLNGYSYLVKEDSLEIWWEEMWEHFERNAFELACKLAYGFENRVDLEIPSSVPNIILEYAAEARKRLTSLSVLSIKDQNVLISFKELIRRFLVENLEQVLARWMSQALDLDSTLITFSNQLADYYFIQYLKDRSFDSVEFTPSWDSSYSVRMRAIVYPKKEEAFTLEIDDSVGQLKQREISLLLEVTDLWNYLQKISITQEIHRQFIGILTGYNPASFSNYLSRTQPNNRDEKYYRNLLRKLSDEKLSVGSKERFKSVIENINNKLNGFV